ncbi:GntR family transcriptional regulator [Aminivibrio pyruvatiphilus]|jgi:GntR family transcriptional repressor for pyruvate dehydrogenase complex|uniref:GntR family transcriptional regulator n=1 Tax=Aminivibrio pyruvatiphilus TaxID=1005740 RepID=A0A4R8MH53_9BACT|nr:FCD domain-containing protein [Aminivibrio pyruvatiphilus]TDY64884.1 GntR family transcriptional regulator [Aminivibrio pyruvatiphilus]
MNETRKDLIRRLTDLVSQGNVVTGGKLPPERELAALLGTTRPLLREGLIALEALGLLEIRDRQGIFLAEGNPDEIKRVLGQAQVWPMEVLSQVMEIRQLLDPGAAALAALRRRERDLEKMDECISMLEKIHREQDPHEAPLGAYWNTVLHATIFRATGNTLLSRLYESLLEMSEKGISAMRMEVLDSAAPDRTEKILEQHRVLVSAIRAQDLLRAREASRLHLKFTIDTLVDLSRVTPISNFFAQRMDSVLK